MDTKINENILLIFLKLHNVLIILTVILAPSVEIYLWNRRSTKISQKTRRHIGM